MITIGFGDIYPVNTSERIFVILMCLFTCGIFAYSLNRIGDIIQNIQKKHKEFKKSISMLNKHMQKRGLSQQLQMDVKKHFEYIYQEDEENNEYGEKMLNQLTGTLKTRVLKEIYGKILSQQKIFKLNFSASFVAELSYYIRERRVGPEQIIFSQGEPINNIYIILKGTIIHQVLMPNQVIKSIRKYASGDIMGVIPFFQEQTADFQAKSEDVVQYAYITRSDFMKVIKKHQEDFETYQQFRDTSLFSPYTGGINQKCPSCNVYYHQTLKRCGYILYDYDQQVTI